MCSLILSFDPSARWPVVMAANRDERLDRAWDPPARYWSGITAGRDRLAGGTWLGVNDDGVVAALLNRTGSLGPQPGKASRGGLPLMALTERSASAARDLVAREEPGRYRAFNLVLVDASGGYVLRSEGNGTVATMVLAPGITMITASDPNDMSSPRIARYKPLFEAAARPDPASGDWREWQALLAARTPPVDTALNVGPHEGFGTVCSSLVGLAPGEVRFRFADGPPDIVGFRSIM